ncbi:hypothetical protein LCGC14_2553030, partial [marine sediment metagenome]
IVLDGFEHGGDQLVLESGENRYQESDANVALHRDEQVTLASQWESEDSAEDGETLVGTARQILDFTDSNVTFDWVCVAVDRSASASVRWIIRALTSGVWADAGPAAEFGGPVKHMFATDKYLFCAMGDVENYYRWDGTTLSTNWAQPGTNIKADAFAWYNDTLYRALANEVIPANNNDGSTWGTAIPFGHDSTDVTDIFASAGYLVIAKPEGMWIYDGNNKFLFSDADVVKDPGNFQGGKFIGGSLYVPKTNQLIKAFISSATNYTINDITPRMKGDVNKVDFGHGFTKRIFEGPGGRIYVTLDDGEGDQAEVLLYNGIWFHQVYRATATMYSSGYSGLNGWLLINDGTTRRKQLRNWLLHEGSAMGLVGMYPRYVALAWIAHYNFKWYDLNRNVVRAFLALPKPPDGWPEGEWLGTVEKFKEHPHLESIVLWLSKRIYGCTPSQWQMLTSKMMTSNKIIIDPTKSGTSNSITIR